MPEIKEEKFSTLDGKEISHFYVEYSKEELGGFQTYQDASDFRMEFVDGHNRNRQLGVLSKRNRRNKDI
jgi:hypothetical protein